MPLTLSDYYFRVRENGAAVFRIDTENRQNRIEMDPIAVVNTRSGEIRALGKRTLDDADLAEINRWISDRQALLARREVDDILRTVDHLNLTAQWVQSRASNDQLDEVTNALLLAMHDLRAVLVRKQSDRTAAARDAG